MKYKESEPKIIDGGLSVDDRGKVSFVNDFNISNTKRFYLVENFSLDTIRAFHGHKKEEKYALVVSGSALFCLSKIINLEKKNKDSKIDRFILSGVKPAILYIPAGYVNGFKSLEENTKIIFFSSSSLKDSLKDDYRFPADFFGNDIWGVKNR